MIFRLWAKQLSVNRFRTRNLHVSAASYKLVQFLLSDIGEGIREVTVSEWFIKVSDKVAQFDNICCVESDKASVNITSRYDGVIKKIYYEVGDKALVGKPLVDIETDESDSESSDETIKDEPLEVREEKPPAPSLSVRPPEIDQNVYQSALSKSLATPAVRRIAMEHGISLSSVLGTGKGGRVMKEDILNHLKIIPTSVISHSSETPCTVADVTPITGIKRVMFNTMTQSNLIPSFNFYEEIRVSKLIQLKKDVQSRAEQKNVKLTFMPFFIKALSKALMEFPLLNSSIDDKNENLIRNKNHNIGFAVDSKGGLVVPNVKNVESLSVLGIAKEMNRILEKGKEGFFNPADLKGGTITISNVGMIGGTYTRPLILPPELVIVALGRIAKKPVIEQNDEIAIADILYSSWTADHRVVDGATLAKFVTLWKYYLENPSALIFDL